MKLFISADIEGCSGITHWDEADPNKPSEYNQFREQMNREVCAAVDGALESGFKEIYVRDAHQDARNLIHSKLPKEVKLIRGWSGGPFMMIDELDSSFDAAIFIGYHAKAGSGGNPLAHTMSSSSIFEIKINDVIASEFLINAYGCGLKSVPLVLISGDEDICNEASRFNKSMQVVAVKKGVGSSTVNIHPDKAVLEIKNRTQIALKNKSQINKCKINMPKRFKIEIKYKDFRRAYRGSFYPNVKLIDDRTLSFESNDYFEILRMMLFC